MMHVRESIRNEMHFLVRIQFSEYSSRPVESQKINRKIAMPLMNDFHFGGVCTSNTIMIL